MKKLNCNNSIVRSLKTNVSKEKVKIGFGNKIGLGYDGCGTHTHGYAVQSEVKNSK